MFFMGACCLRWFQPNWSFVYRDSCHYAKGNYNRYLGSMRIGHNGFVGFSAKPSNIMSIFGGLLRNSVYYVEDGMQFRQYLDSLKLPVYHNGNRY